MSLLWWLPSIKARSVAVETRSADLISNDSTDFEGIADKVEELQRSLEYAHQLCDQANLQFEKYRIDMAELKESLVTEQNSNAGLYRSLAAERAKTSHLDAQVSAMKPELKRQRVLASQLQARLNAEIASLSAMTRHARTLEARLVDAQLDLEYLRCTTIAEPSLPIVSANQDAPLPIQPFVVVLVDGDSYKWVSKFNSQDTNPTGPGGLAATSLCNEVIKYIFDQKGAIPLNSKVITRVFCNMSSPHGGFMDSSGIWRRGGRLGIPKREFARQFTEKMPLFDFFDAGTGKERADDKIRENFHLYLSSPNCHAVFVAACLDNGFARMLEQYTNHPTAYQKIVLISPGYVALEILALGLRQVEWPSVFSPRKAPKDMALKYQRALASQQSHKGLQRSLSASAINGDELAPDTLHEILARVEAWDMNAAMGKYSNGVGLRISPTSGKEADHSEVSEAVKLDDSTDYGID